jgi:hypothetical protein
MNQINLNAMLVESGLPGIAGQSGHISGILRLDAEHSFLYIDEVGGQVLPIVESGFKARLLDTVPCHVGGPYLYADLVSLNVEMGTLSSEVVVMRVESGRLMRDGETFDF